MKYLKMLINKFLKKIKEMPLPVKASFAYMVVNFMQKGMSFLTAPIFTRILTPAEFGKISIYSSWTEILGMFAMLNLYQSVYNNGILEFKEDRNNFTFSMLQLCNFLTIFTFIVIWGINHFIFDFLNMPNMLICFMFVSFLFEPAFEFWKTQQRFEYRYKMVCCYLLLIMLGSPAMAVGGIFLFPGMKVEARIIGGQLVTLLLGIGCYALEIYRSSGKVDLKYWKYGIWFNLPLLPYMISTYILNCSDRLMISYMIGDDAAGIYSIAYTIASIVGVLWASVNAALTPTMYKRCYDGRINTLSELVLPIVTCYGILCIVIMGTVPEVIRFLAPSSYGKGMYAVPAIIGGVFFNSCFSMFTNIIFVKKKQKYIMYAGVFAAVLNFVLNLIFIPRYGYLAAGYTTLASYFIQYMGMCFGMDRIVEEKVYDKKPILAVSFMTLLASAVLPLTYDGAVVRYTIMIVLALIIWKRRHVFLAISS